MAGKVLPLIALIASTALAPSAFADDQQTRFPRWYIGLSGGLAVHEDEDVNGPATVSGEATYDNGYALSGAIGYMPAMSNGGGGLRLEGEVFLAKNKIDQATVGGAINSNTSGEGQVVSYMFNVLYDFNGPHSLLPYVGAGAGFGKVELPRGAGFRNVNGDDDVFAWQLLTGLGYEPISIPNTIWSIGYRYHVLNEASYSTPTGIITIDNAVHSIEGGVRLRF